MSFYVCKTTTKSFCYIWKPFWFCLCYHLYSVKTPEFFRALLQTIPTTPDLIFPSHLIFNMPSLYFEGLKFFLTMKNPYLQHWNKKNQKSYLLLLRMTLSQRVNFLRVSFLMINLNDLYDAFIVCSSMIVITLVGEFINWITAWNLDYSAFVSKYWETFFQLRKWDRTYSIERILQSKCYGLEHGLFYKLDIVDLSLWEVEFLQVRTK